MARYPRSVSASYDHSPGEGRLVTLERELITLSGGCETSESRVVAIGYVEYAEERCVLGRS
jgi:hypothetical protein